MTPPSTRLLTALFVALASLASLAACGDGSDAENDLNAAVDEAEATAESLVDEADETVQNEDGVTEAAQGAADDLRDVIGDDELVTLFQAVDAAGFDDIAEAERFTFFAPNDGAFAALDTELLAGLLADPEALREVLRDHLLDETVLAADLPTDGTVTTTGGLELTFDSSGDQPTVNGIPIVRTDVMVDDRGVVHVIDGVLLDN